MREEAVDMVHLWVAADATIARARGQNEMLDEQLALRAEQIGQRFLAAWPLEFMRLLDLDRGQGAPLGAEPVARAREFLFLCQQRLPRGEPFFAIDDLMLCHFQLPPNCVTPLACRHAPP